MEEPLPVSDHVYIARKELFECAVRGAGERDHHRVRHVAWFLTSIGVVFVSPDRKSVV